MAEKDSKQPTASKSGSARPATPAATSRTAAARPGATKPTAATSRPAATAPTKSAASTKPAATARPTATAAKPAATTKTPTTPARPTTTTKATTTPARPAATTKAAKPTVAASRSVEKPQAKPAANKADAKSSGEREMVGILGNKTVRISIVAVLAFILIGSLILGIILGAKACKKTNDPGLPVNVTKPYDTDKKGTTIVGYAAEQLGTVDRNIPQTTKNEGLDAYPTYGYTLKSVIGSSDDKVAARNALIAESSYLTATGTWNAGGGNYKWMDSAGKLYNGTTAAPEPTLDKNGQHRQLYKHSASVGLYFGDVADDEPGIIKSVTMRPRSYTRGYGVTGVYAPAGEVIKIEMSEADMNATGGIVIHIGQALYNGKANNIWAAKGQMQRIPHLLNTMVVDKNTSVLQNGVYTAYVGSFIGGPIYIRNETATFTVTISGGVTYSHFILGYTTQDEFEKNAKSSTPYFDLEIWDTGVLHSGPKYYAQSFSYDDIYKVAVLWDKVASVTTTGSTQGIVFLFDPFVAAGAAVAFPGQGSVNCPADWMNGALNYNTIVSSGAWGNFHEYHHNFQGYGVGAGGEVTNNGMTLVSYALFTKISSHRGISGYGGAGLGGWNSYTSATWALNEVLKIAKPDENPSNGNKGLSLYATLLHNFGPDAYIQSKLQQRSKHYGENYQGYLRAWQDITHQDMTYYFKDILQGIDETTAAKWRNADYPTFVPISSVYQTGRSYTFDGEKKYITTMQPYVIPTEYDFTVDLSKYTAPSGQYASGSVMLPDGFDYTVKAISDPENGSIVNKDLGGKKFTYRPDGTKRSGKIVVTLGLTKTNAGIVTNRLDDVDLVLEFEPSHETNKIKLKRTTYTYAAADMYTDAETAFESNYAGYTGTPYTRDHTNPVQNCNTDIWFYPNTDAMHNAHPDAPDEYFIHDNTIEEIEGKLYFEDAGKYRIYLRGRKNCAVYYSVDGGETYQLGAAVKNGKGAGFYANDPNSYFDLELKEHSWVHVKEILIVQSAVSSYIGLGTAKWTEPMFTMTEDEDGTIHYFDYQGHEVTEEEANNAELIAPTKASYVNAYRPSYEFPSNASFETDYFYTRKYTYSYSVKHNDLQQSVVGDPKCPDNFPIENLFDNDLTTACSSPAVVTPTDPWELTVDLGKTIQANRFVLTGRLNNNAGNQNQTPDSITLYVGETLEDMREVMSFDNGKVNGVTLQFDFPAATFRYYRLVVRKTVQGRFAAIANIEFSNNIPNGNHITPDNEMFTYQGTWQGAQANSSFGHVYVANKGASMSFEFTGTRLMLLSSAAYGKNFEVYIDGQKIDSIAVKEDPSPFAVSYISSELTAGKHTVTVQCLGETNIDSVVTFA